MGNLLFSPSGRIGPDAYFKGIMIIAVISALFQIIVGLVPALGILGLLMIAFFVAFIFLGIKRSHDAGKSGWMVLTHILLAMGLGAAIQIILGIVGLGTPGAAEVIEMAQNGEVYKPSIVTVIVSAIAGLVSSAILATLVNKFNPSDAGDNQYGPATPNLT